MECYTPGQGTPSRYTLRPGEFNAGIAHVMLKAILVAAVPTLSAPIGRLDGARKATVPAAGLQARAEPIDGTAIGAGIAARDILQQVHKEQMRRAEPPSSDAESFSHIAHILNRHDSRGATERQSQVVTCAMDELLKDELILAGAGTAVTAAAGGAYVLYIHHKMKEADKHSNDTTSPSAPPVMRPLM
ncbi:hypothetical protein BC835DRAFT_1424539 [Cytidiella melzeri]|nr:hypothetical protein BC835DRAFT_1424539 [Cytidiella melzeri]